MWTRYQSVVQFDECKPRTGCFDTVATIACSRIFSRMEKKVKSLLRLLHRMTFQFSPSGQLEHIKVIFQHLCGETVC